MPCVGMCVTVQAVSFLHVVLSKGGGENRKSHMHKNTQLSSHTQERTMFFFCEKRRNHEKPLSTSSGTRRENPVTGNERSVRSLRVSRHAEGIGRGGSHGMQT